jgi:2-dehydropantoate 2-reductase
MAFTMKAYDTAPAIDELQKTVIRKPPPILCLQNGVGNEESLASAFGSDRVAAGALTTPVSVVVPGVVVEEKARGIVISDEHPVATRMIDALRQTTLEMQTTSRADSLKWSKLLLNQMGNAASAILDMPPGEIYAHRDLFRVERAAMIETLRVMHAQGIPAINLPGVPARTLAMLLGRLPSRLLQAILAPRVRRGRGGKMPSLHQDMVRNRRRSEVIWLNGAVARAGEAVNVDAPVNHALALTLMDILEGRAQREQFRNHPEMLLAAVRVAT